MPAPISESARYTHECDRCTFLGRDGEHDVYVCPQVGWPTVILRFASDGPDYHSGAHLVDRLPDGMRERASDLMQEMKA